MRSTRSSAQGEDASLVANDAGRAIRAPRFAEERRVERGLRRSSPGRAPEAAPLDLVEDWAAGHRSAGVRKDDERGVEQAVPWGGNAIHRGFSVGDAGAIRSDWIRSACRPARVAGRGAYSSAEFGRPPASRAPSRWSRTSRWMDQAPRRPAFRRGPTHQGSVAHRHRGPREPACRQHGRGAQPRVHPEGHCERCAGQPGRHHEPHRLPRVDACAGERRGAPW